jgi:hypothetical protein
LENAEAFGAAARDRRIVSVDREIDRIADLRKTVRLKTGAVVNRR